jgi:hypothetical protein
VLIHKPEIEYTHAKQEDDAGKRPSVSCKPFFAHKHLRRLLGIKI